MAALPTFLVIGAQKAGTTWLAGLLRQHPEVAMPERKELHFFDRGSGHEDRLDRYVASFPAGPGAIAVGEATPNYLWVLDALPPEVEGCCDTRSFGARAHPALNPDPASTIAALLPGVRVVVLLRDPVERAASAFRHHVRMRRLPPSARLVGGPLTRRRIVDRHGIVAMGFYDQQLAHWARHVRNDRLLVLSLEDDVEVDPTGTFARVCEHIGISPDFRPERTAQRANASASDAFLWSHYYAPRLARRAFAVAPLDRIPAPRVDLPAEDRAALARLYAPGVRRLEHRVGRSFDAWGTCAASASNVAHGGR